MNIINRNKVILIGLALGGAFGYAYYLFVGCDSGSCSISSNPLNSSIYGAAMGGLLFSMLKSKKGNRERLKSLLMDKNTTIIDVRTTGEFQGGHVNGSVNIPMDQVVSRLDEIKKMNQPIVLCCASGNRSGQVANYLKQQGIDCENGGGWMEVNGMIQ